MAKEVEMGTRMKLVAVSMAVLAVTVSVQDAVATSRRTHNESSVTLTGRTILTARRTSAITVRIPRTVSVSASWFENPHISLEGSGRLVGLALVSKRSPESRLLLAGKYRTCTEPGCADGRPVEFILGRGMKFSSDWQRVTIPSGEYHLVVITDGTPVRASLQLPALAGESKLALSRPVGFELDSPAALPATSPLYAAHAETGLRGKGLSLAVAWLKTEVEGVAGHGACFYREATPSGPIAYVPPCPLADKRPLTTVTDPQMNRSWTHLFWMAPWLPSGMGVWHAAAAQASGQGSLFLWVQLKP